MAKDDVVHGPNGAGDEWDAWAEEEEDKPALPTRPFVTAPPAAAVQAEDEDWGAWGADDNAAAEVEDVEAKAPPNGVDGEDDEESSAWGWDDPANAEPESIVKSPTKAQADQARPSQTSSNERELTLKETYTATEISCTLATLITTLVTDATALLDPTSTFSSLSLIHI